MKVTLTFVPPNGGEQDYQLSFELPSIPQQGDYISITRPDSEGTFDFIVRRTWWHLEYPENALYGSSSNPVHGAVGSIVVECEFAKGGFSNQDHLSSCEMYRVRTGVLKEFEASGY